MKPLALLLALACSPAFAAQQLMVFSASWCGACREFKADHERDPALTGGLELVTVDVDRNRDQVRRYRVRAMPTFILLEDGKEVRRQVGYQGPERLRQWLGR